MIRYLLIGLVIFLIVRLFIVYGSSERGVKKDTEPEKKNKKPQNGVPKNIGEYIDYEEVKKSKE